MTMVSSSELLSGPSLCSVISVSKQMNIMLIPVHVLSNFIKISYILILTIMCNNFIKRCSLYDSVYKDKITVLSFVGFY